jgi:hypothetical protein
MATMTALRFLAARGHKEAQGFLAALDYPYAKPLPGKRGTKGA